MDVMLSFNNKVYVLKLHEVDIWTHQATMDDTEMAIFITEILKNNPETKTTVYVNLGQEIKQTNYVQS